jgi:hypothetical protein
MSFGIKELTVNFQDCTIIQEMKEFMPYGMRVETCPFARLYFG